MRLIKQISSNKDDSKAFDSIVLQGDSSIILDCIKRGEDDEDVSRGGLPKRKGRSVMLRVYDSLGGTCRGCIRWNKDYLPVSKVYHTNTLEDDLTEIILTKEGHEFDFTLRPFEVKTFRLQLL